MANSGDEKNTYQIEYQFAYQSAYQSAYQNDPSVENLIKLMIHDFPCDLLFISWYVGQGYWYVPCIASGLNITNIDWYSSDEPTAANLPTVSLPSARHSSEDQIKTQLKINRCKLVIHGTQPLNIPSFKKFVITAFMEKIYHMDLLRRQKIRQELTLSNISHSIRTPLNGILHMTKAVAENKEAIQYLNQSAVALATNIFDIIDMTKLELGKLTLNKTIFNIRHMIQTTLDLANTLNKSNDVTLVHHIDESVPSYIYSDEKRVKQILINLLENALQHTRKGEISLYAAATIINLASEDAEMGNSLVENNTAFDYQYNISFIIKDTGPGISEKVRQNLFKPLELVSNAKQQGLSLRLSYLLARLLNGDLKLLLSGPIGSCFEFTIVACDEEPPEVISKTIKNLKNKTVLLLSDSSVDLIARVLQKYLISYTVANTIDEVEILHRDKKYDLIIVQVDDIENHTVENHTVENHTVENHTVENCATKLKKIYPSVHMLLISDRINKEYTYFLDSDHDDITFKIKLVDIFSGDARFDNKEVRILVVEDELINRIVIERLLRQAGYISITMASNGEEALNIYSRDPQAFDILLIDIRMPLMSGYELADKIHEINPTARMLGVTAQMVIEDTVQPWFNEFIYKPIDFNELQKKINELLMQCHH
jgi:two-component system sensor histidine kinase/response regulator